LSQGLVLQNISFQDIIKDVSINLKTGQTYCLIGYNGSGKSLILKIAAGIQEPSSGAVLFQDTSIYDVSRSQRLKINSRIGFVFQNAALVSNMNVYDNLSVGLKYHTKLKEKEIEDKVDFFLNKINLYLKKYLMPSDLSLGEKKLVGFARALIDNPDVLIMDEPTALIDKKTSHFIIEIIEEFEDQEKAVLMTSSDTDLIFNVSDTVGVLMESRIKEEGEPYDIKYSHDKEVKELLSNIKLIKTEEVESEILRILK